MSDLNAALAEHRVIPVLTVSGAERGSRLAQALATGGLPLAEVTLRADGSLEALGAMAQSEEVLVGAGTVLTAEQADSAVAAGAHFVVSPGLDVTVVRRCHELGVPVVPGVATPSEVMSALREGMQLLKLFPADLLGGPAAVRALSAPFPGVRFIPTGGVRADTAPTYLSERAVLAVGGSWMAPPDLVAQSAWDEISRRVRHVVRVLANTTKEPA